MEVSFKKVLKYVEKNYEKPFKNIHKKV